MNSFLPPEFSPAYIVMGIGILIAFLPRAYRNLLGLVGLFLGLMHLFAYGLPGFGEVSFYGVTDVFGLEMTAVRVDRLSFIFALIFHIAAILNVIYGWSHATRLEASMGLVYAGAAIGGALAGDLLTLFVYWEAAALSSVFIVWAGGGHAAFKAGMRYLVIQVISGLLLLAGIVLHIHAGNTLDFNSFMTGIEGEYGKHVEKSVFELSPAAMLIFLSFGIKAAFPFMHTWLQDSYPKATAVGAVVLSAFTTKLAIYALARGFAGLDMLIAIGSVMVAFPVFFAILENDLRKVLAYSLNNQLGFMVIAVGIGTPLALNGATSHAFVHIIYKSLLFMGMGAVLVRAGSAKATDLGGLHKSMPLTTILTIIGPMSISAFPFFSGFVAKSMISDAAAAAHLLLPYMAILFASSGVLEHSGIKIPYFAFFAKDQFAPSNTGKARPKEAPTPMLIAMGLAATICILIGIAPQLLYLIVPYEVSFKTYTAGHVISQMQLLLFSILSFALLLRLGLYPPEIRSVNLDVDWFWRVPGRMAFMGAVKAVAAIWKGVWGGTRSLTQGVVTRLYYTHGPEGRIARTWPVGYTALTTAVFLGVALVWVFLTQ